jgi:hypothetical protein
MEAELKKKENKPQPKVDFSRENTHTEKHW